jgi:hypothetical protein
MNQPLVDVTTPRAFGYDKSKPFFIGMVSESNLRDNFGSRGDQNNVLQEIQCDISLLAKTNNLISAVEHIPIRKGCLLPKFIDLLKA